MPLDEAHNLQAPQHWAICCGGTGLRGLCHALMKQAASRLRQPSGVPGSATPIHGGQDDGDALKSGVGDAPLRLTFVVATSDDGGSSRAIMDAVGGLAVGDCRNLALTLVESMLGALGEGPTSTWAFGTDAIQLQGRRSLHGLLGHRLCAASDAAARGELVDVVLPRLELWGDASEEHPPPSTGGIDSWSMASAARAARDALLAFLAAVQHGAPPPPPGIGEEGDPRHHGKQAHRHPIRFTYRNASIGNLVVMGKLLSLLGSYDSCSTPAPTSDAAASPMYQAVNWLLHDVFHLAVLQAALRVAVDVVPSMDYYFLATPTEGEGPTTDSVVVPQGDVVALCTTALPQDKVAPAAGGGADGCCVLLPLPRVALVARYTDGSEVVGQRAISYGGHHHHAHPLHQQHGDGFAPPAKTVDGSCHAEVGVAAVAEDDDVFVTVKRCTALPRGGTTPFVTAPSTNGSNAQAQVHPRVSRLSIRQLVPPHAPGRSGRGPLSIAPSRMLSVMLPGCDGTGSDTPSPVAARWLLARGSLLTSTLAAALSVPALSLGGPTISNATGQDVVLMVNGWQDKETVGVDTFGDLLATIASVLPTCRVAELWLPSRGYHHDGSATAVWPGGTPPPLVCLQYFGAPTTSSGVVGPTGGGEGHDYGIGAFDDAAVAAHMFGGCLSTK